MVKLLRDERQWSQALLFLETHCTELPQEQLTSHRNALLRESASEHAVQARNPRNPSRQTSYTEFMRVVGLMSAEDEELHLLAHGYKEELVERYIGRGNYTKAAKVLSADNRRVDAANILCEANPDAKVTDLELATELLLAHAVQKECSQEDRLQAVVKAQQLQERKREKEKEKDDDQRGAILRDPRPGENRDSSGGEAQHGLDLFMARIDPNVNSKEARLHHLRGTCSQGDNALVRVLAGYELFCIQSKQVGNESGMSPPHAMLHGKLMQECIALIREVDSIKSQLAGNDVSKDLQVLRCEQVFGVRRLFGSCCISPARKAIMEWMLESDSQTNTHVDASKNQHRPATNSEGDVLIDESLLVSMLNQYLLRVRKILICKAVLTLNSELAQVKADVTESTLACLLHLVWMISTTRDKDKEMGTVSDVERVEAGDLVQHKGYIENHRTGALAIVLEKLPSGIIGLSKSQRFKVKMAIGDAELTLNAQNVTPLFSRTGLGTNSEKYSLQ